MTNYLLQTTGIGVGALIGGPPVALLGVLFTPMLAKIAEALGDRTIARIKGATRAIEGLSYHELLRPDGCRARPPAWQGRQPMSARTWFIALGSAASPGDPPAVLGAVSSTAGAPRAWRIAASVKVAHVLGGSVRPFVSAPEWASFRLGLVRYVEAAR